MRLNPCMPYSLRKKCILRASDVLNAEKGPFFAHKVCSKVKGAVVDIRVHKIAATV
jgi:hypothetical protein